MANDSWPRAHASRQTKEHGVGALGLDQGCAPWLAVGHESRVMIPEVSAINDHASTIKFRATIKNQPKAVQSNAI